MDVVDMIEFSIFAIIFCAVLLGMILLCALAWMHNVILGFIVTVITAVILLVAMVYCNN